MDIVFERLAQNETVMRTFGAIAVIVRSMVIVLAHRFGKDIFGPLNVFRNARQISQPQGRTVFFDQPHQVDPVKSEVVPFEAEFLLREIERLVDEVYITCFHPF